MLIVVIQNNNMKKLALLILLTLFMSPSWSSEERGIFMPYRKDKSTIDTKLSEDEAVFKFTFAGIIDGKKKRSVLYSIDGAEHEELLIDNEYFSVKTTPGKHVFQFFYDQDHFEITTDSLEIRAQYRDDYTVFFENSKYPIDVDKPVIYLYPEEKTDIKVQVIPKGRMVFTYPNYDNEWKFTAAPDGTLNFGKKEYNYLFWEAKQDYRLSSLDMQTGFYVGKEQTISFLEEKLTMAGLTSKEQADFITYWGPRLQQNQLNFVHFLFNEECNQFADLEITPKPDNIFRIYILWKKADPRINYTVDEQLIPSISRNGFNVMEWGGSELKTEFNLGKL